MCVWVTIGLYVASLPGLSAASSLQTCDGRDAASQVRELRYRWLVSGHRCSMLSQCSLWSVVMVVIESVMTSEYVEIVLQACSSAATEVT